MSTGSGRQGLRVGPGWAQAKAVAGPPDSLRKFSPVVSYLSCSHSGGGG